MKENLLQLKPPDRFNFAETMRLAGITDEEVGKLLQEYWDRIHWHYGDLVDRMQNMPATVNLAEVCLLLDNLTHPDREPNEALNTVIADLRARVARALEANPPRSFEKLFDDSDAATVVTKNLGGKHSHGGEWERRRHFERFFEHSKDDAEKTTMAKMLLNPPRDTERILGRQQVLEALSGLENLDALIALKNDAYELLDGCGLLKYCEASPFNEDRLVCWYHRGVEKVCGRDSDEYDEDTYVPIKPIIDADLANIAKGKKALAEIIQFFEAMGGEVAHSIAASFRSLLADAELTLNEKVFLEPSEEKAKYSRYGEGGFWDKIDDFVELRVEQFLCKFGAVLEFAALIKSQKWAKASFDDTQPDCYEGAWNLSRPKDRQKARDFPPSSDTVVFTGPNKSGKSFALMRDFYIRLAGQATGFGPFAKGNLRVFDSLAIVDRVQTDHARDLSAFMRDMTDWIEVLTGLKGRTCLYVDEGLSSTSPEDGADILRAITLHVGSTGGRIVHANLNEIFVAAMAGSGAPVSVYHFEDYEMYPGAKDSNSIDVARTVGFPERVLTAAQASLEGKAIFPEVQSAPRFRPITRFATAEREAQKLATLSAAEFFPQDPSDGILKLYSDDSDFTPEGLFAKNRGQEFFVEEMRSLNEAMARMILYVGKLSSEQILERRTMFKELLNNGLHQVVHDLTTKLLLLETSYAKIAGAEAKGGVNKALNPFSKKESDQKEPSYTEQDLQKAVAFLEINRKLLAERFPCTALLEYLKTASSSQISLDDEAFVLRMKELETVNDLLPMVPFDEINLDDIQSELAILCLVEGSPDDETPKPIDKKPGDDVVQMFHQLAIIGSGMASILQSLPEQLQAFESLQKTLKSTDSVYLHQIANHLAPIFDKIISLQDIPPSAKVMARNSMPGKSRLGRKDEDLDDRFRDFFRAMGSFGADLPFANELKHLRALCLFSSFIADQGLCPVEFNDTGAIELSNSFSLAARKDRRIPNNIFIGGKHEKLQIITGPNGSGKTFHEKTLIINLLKAYATGFTAAKSANIPLLDLLIYLDRVTQKSDDDSSFTNEASYWKELFGFLEGQGAVLVCADEAFSTASPNYQAALVFATVSEFHVTGQILMLALHHHQAIDQITRSSCGAAKPYHFAFDLNDGGIDFHYKLQLGHAQSEAIRVARKLGFPAEILDRIS